MKIPGITTDLYTIPEIDTEHQSPANIHIDTSVVGFWSAPVSIRFTRDHFNAQWAAEVSHSSGGTERQKHFNDYLLAELAFADAVRASVLHAQRVILTHSNDLERNYQEAVTAAREQREAELAKREAALASDPALGDAAARAMVATAWQRKRDGAGDVTIKSIHRGDPRSPMCIHATQRGGRITFTAGSLNFSRSEVIAILSVSSNRSHIIEA